MNTQLICDPGDLAVPLALTFPDLEDEIHRAFAQLIRVLLVCCHDPASSQVSWPPDSPGWINLDGFVFRFNRRRPASRGLVFYRVLELAATHDPVRYRDLVASQPRLRAYSGPPQARGRTPSLDRPPAGRPWRDHDLESSG